MDRRPLIVLARSLLLFILIVASTAAPRPTAANYLPGEDLGNGSGTLAPGATFLTNLIGPGPANLRLEVSGGATTDIAKLTLQNGTGTETWDVQSGEIAWAYANLPDGSTTVRIENMGSTSLQFQFNAYARGVVNNIAGGATTWDGVANGDGLQSSIQLNILTPGLYRFALDASSGSFQLNVDDNYIRKTVASGSPPSSNDSVYYLSQGAHTFNIEQDPNEATTAWSLQITLVGGLDTLPSTENSARLGGPDFFTEERIPLQFEADQPVNIRIQASGAASDSLIVELFNGSDSVYTSIPVFGGEVAWGTSLLAGGANMLRVAAADSNNASLAYTVQISAIGQPGFTWQGTSYGSTNGNSSIRLTFPEDGLYQFALEASASSRYQFMLANNYLKTIATEAGDTFTAFVPQGTHTLTVDQDSQVASTAWSIAISPTATMMDSLTYAQEGVTLGGSGNDFREEWLPLYVAANQKVNLKVTATGSITDALQVELFNTDTQVYSATTIYGGEIFWGTSDLIGGSNRIRVVAHPNNAAAMNYQIEVRSLDDIPSTWQGVARGDGLNSTVQLNVPADGIYTVVLTMTEGLGIVQVDSESTVTRSTDLAMVNTTQRWPLTAGRHTFTFMQDPSQPRTVWEILATQRRSSGNSMYLPLIQR